MNALDLATKWINIKKISNANWGKLCGIFQNLLKKYNSDEISRAIQVHTRQYPNKDIEEFSYYCKRIIINERRKR